LDRWGWKVFETPGVEPVFPKKGGPETVIPRGLSLSGNRCNGHCKSRHSRHGGHRTQRLRRDEVELRQAIRGLMWLKEVRKSTLVRHRNGVRCSTKRFISDRSQRSG
jgi:hypothetical protein